MWSPEDVDEQKKYRLQLCQSGSRRFFHLSEIRDAEEKIQLAEAVLTTAEVPSELLKKRYFQRIADTVLLSNGDRFFVDFHGVWLTENEILQMAAGVDDQDIQWITGIEPEFAPV